MTPFGKNARIIRQLVTNQYSMSLQNGTDIGNAEVQQY